MSSDEEDSDCPLCMEELDIADRNFRPCPCGYQICRFCWHHIKTNLNGRCPACRRLYSDQIVEFVPVSAEEIMRLKKEKKEKDRQTRDMRDPSRRQLSNIRVVQKNLVYVLGLSLKHASIENEFFKKFGRIDKVVISKRSAPTSHSSVGIYVTFARKEDAGKAIEGLNGLEYEGKTLRASYGTTKYCTYYLRHMSCPNPNCMYLHEPGDDVDSYNKDTTAVPVGKQPASSVSTTSSSAFPNKRPATASLKSSASTTTATTPESKPATVPRTWAPIPKVVPIPPVIIPEPEPMQEDAPPSPPFKEVVKPTNVKKTPVLPAASTSTVIKKAKKPSVEKLVKKVVAEDERPALPATASWAKASPVLNGKSVITPLNFGPSLSDALHAPQKPKHSPSLKVKKEKKTKGKMVRLEEFEEAEREAKIAASRPKVVPKPVVVETPSVQVPAVEEVAIKSPIVEEQVEKEEQVSPMAQEQKDQVEQQVPDMIKEEIKTETLETEVEDIKDTVNVDEPDVTPEENVESVHEAPMIEKKDEQIHTLEESTPDEQPETEEKVEGLASLNDEIIKAFDHAAHESSEKIQADAQETKDDISEHGSVHLNEPLQISSPMAAMERLSQLVQQEIMTDSPGTPQLENPLQQQQQQQQQQAPLPSHPGMNRFEMGIPMRPPMPPPGLSGLAPPPPPPDWMGRSFDPFNGQDPSLIAARRLQHSQRMLEASGLFAGGAGFGQPPVVGPRFGFHPHAPPPPPPPSNFLPHPPPPPPMGMFPPPPPHMMNMTSPMGSPFGPPPPQRPMVPMDELRNEFNGLKMEDQSREDFRALLPNVNISFNSLQEKRRAEEMYQQQQLFLRQQHRMENENRQQEKVLSYPQQQQQPWQPPMEEIKRENPDVRVEAQNFFGEFLRKAASTTPQHEMSPKKEEQPANLAFQDPAIMSVRLVNGNNNHPEAPPAVNHDAVRSQNTILQILGGQPMSLEQQHHLHHQQQLHQQQQMHHFHQQQRHLQQQRQQQMDMEQGRMMHDMGQKHFNNNNTMFMNGPPPPPQQQQFNNPSFHPPQPNYMQFREPNNMNRMGPPPPGMIRPPMPPPHQQQQNDMRFRHHHPGMFNSSEQQ